MRKLIILSALGVAALAGACASSVDTANKADFGLSVEQMSQAQTDPGVVSDQAPEGSGAVGALAQQRYQSGRTRPLMPAATSTANPTTN